jgi:hypothetical protein
VKKFQFLEKVSGVSKVSMSTSRVLSEALKRSVKYEGFDEKKKNEASDVKKIAKAVTISWSTEAKLKLLKKL